MLCSGCGKCCRETEMELSSNDIKRLAKGYNPEDFMVIRGGVPRLRNVDGSCYFYSTAVGKCRIYKMRPLGCRLYPLVYVEGEGITLDELCPMGHTVSGKEFKRKAKALKKLLEKIDEERVSRQWRRAI